jgi:hypothetical protein
LTRSRHGREGVSPERGPCRPRTFPVSPAAIGSPDPRSTASGTPLQTRRCEIPLIRASDRVRTEAPSTYRSLPLHRHCGQVFDTAGPRVIQQRRSIASGAGDPCSSFSTSIAASGQSSPQSAESASAVIVSYGPVGWLAPADSDDRSARRRRSRPACALPRFRSRGRNRRHDRIRVSRRRRSGYR